MLHVHSCMQLLKITQQGCLLSQQQQAVICAKLLTEHVLLTGARENEVLATDTTSLNLYKALACCLQLQKGRSVVLSGMRAGACRGV